MFRISPSTTSQIVVACRYARSRHHLAVAEEQAGIELVGAEFRIQSLCECQSGIAGSRDVAAALETFNLAVLKPLQTAVVDKVGSTLDGTSCEVSACADVCLVCILVAAYQTVFEDVCVACRKQSLGLSHVAAGVAYGEVLGVEA